MLTFSDLHDLNQLKLGLLSTFAPYSMFNSPLLMPLHEYAYTAQTSS